MSSGCILSAAAAAAAAEKEEKRGPGLALRSCSSSIGQTMAGSDLGGTRQIKGVGRNPVGVCQ